MNDIVAGNDIALGPGWDRLETHRGESFRWVNNDAVLYVATLKRLDYQLVVQVEPGPGVGLRPFTLRALEGEAKQLADALVKGRQQAVLTIPSSELKVHTLTLHTNEGGKAAPNDPRVLNFRVFKMSLNQMPGDVIKPGAGFSLGTGWYPLESFSGETFRWVNNDAIVELSTAATGPLELELEPGPGVEQGVFDLTVLDSAGAKFQTIPIKARERISIAIPPDMSRPTAIRLHVDGGGKTTSEDKRVMNFRVFEHTLAPSAQPAVANPKPRTPTVASAGASQ
jgi:hypothetical protein